MKIFLASSSPRRVDLLKKIFPVMEVISPQVNEIDSGDYSPQHIVIKNAFRKAMDVQKMIQHSKALLISADTLIYINDCQILGKPSDRQDAINYLKLLSDSTHYVVTGVALLLMDKKSKEWRLFSEKTEVVFHPLSSFDIEAYVDQYQPLDKAGAYGIQELPSGFVKEWKGSLDNVIGLPSERILEELSLMGLSHCLIK